MLKNKNFNYAILIFTITLTVLFAYAEYYPVDEITEVEKIEAEVSQEKQDNLVITSN